VFQGVEKLALWRIFQETLGFKNKTTPTISPELAMSLPKLFTITLQYIKTQNAGQNVESLPSCSLDI